MRTSTRNGADGDSVRRESPLAPLLRAEIERRQPTSIEEMNQIAAEVSDRYNATAQEEMGGLSPEQVALLIYGDWMDNAMRLNRGLGLHELQGAHLFHNARCVLDAIRETGTVKATATANFNRKLATRMFEEFAMPRSERKATAEYNKVINQDDVPHLTLLRYLLPQAGLLLYRKGEFKLTKRASPMMAEVGAGELYMLLFRTLFLRIDLAAMDGLPHAPAVQQTVGFSMYQVWRRLNDWTPLKDVTPFMFLPSVLKMLPSGPTWESAATSYARTRILRPLNYMGLVEYDDEDRLLGPDLVRKTPLFNRFIQYCLPPLAQ